MHGYVLSGPRLSCSLPVPFLTSLPRRRLRRLQRGSVPRWETEGVEVMITTEGSPQATAPKPSLSTSNEALTVRRNAHFYSWRGNCYTQDRDQNWYQVDARLC